jgi:dolichol-phosphate mannosyltransferase
MYYIFLPAYNEERDIRTLLLRIRDAMQGIGLDYKVIVVNDGSIDGTAQAVLSCQALMPVELVNHEKNKGLGQAMLTGLTHAEKIINDQDVLVTMDADNTHDPRLIQAMDAKIRAGADLVIASRYQSGGEEIGLSRLRSFLSRGASSLLSLFFPIPGAKDYTCGYRAYQGEIIRRAFHRFGEKLVEERGFTCMAEILIKMRLIHARVAEVPLVLRYDLKSGQSKMKVIRTILRYFVLISRNLFSRPSAEMRKPV